MSNENQTIIRAPHDRNNPYVISDRRIYENPNLSWKAKGLLAYLLTRPDNWKVRLSHLEKQSTDGRDAVRSGVAELKAAGYITVKRVRDESGKFAEVQYTVYETPQNFNAPQTGFPALEKPTAENPQLINNDYTNNDLTNIEDGAKNAPEALPPDAPTSKDKEVSPSESTLLLDSTLYSDRLLSSTIATNVAARTGRNAKPPKRFQSIQQRDAWRAAVAAIHAVNNGTSEAVLKQFVDKALVAGRTDMAGVISYVAACARNGAQPYQRADSAPPMQTRVYTEAEAAALADGFFSA